MTQEFYANNATTTLNNGGTLTSGATSCTVTDGSVFPATGNFRLIIDSEIIIVGARTANVLSSLSRGAEGTSAASHVDGSTVTNVLTAGSMTALITGGGYNGSFATLAGVDVSASTSLILPLGTTPAETAEGSVFWDSDDDKLTVGTGAGRKTMLNEGGLVTSLTGGNYKAFYSDGSGNVTALALGAAGTVFQSNGASSAPSFVAGSAITTAVGVPSGDVAVTSANTWYDACSVSCVAGTWLLMAHINMYGGVAPTYVAKIYDATAPAPNTPVSEPAGSSTGANQTLPLMAIVTPGVTTTYTLAGLCTASGATISQSNVIGSATGPSTQLIALKIG